MKKAYLQIAESNFKKQDGDGYYIFELPLIAFIQDKDGQATDKEGKYFRIKIDGKGNPEKY